MGTARYGNKASFVANASVGLTREGEESLSEIFNHEVGESEVCTRTRERRGRIPSWAQAKGGCWAWPRGKMRGEGRSSRSWKGWRAI